MDAFRFSDLQRLVVKLGSSLLVDADGRFDPDSLQAIAGDIATLKARDHGVLIVSSGAVAIGCHVLDINRRRARLEGLQAAAAAGQGQLVQAWQKALGEHGILTAQILLTPDDTENRRRFLNAKGTLLKLLEHGVVPIINENDTVATDELRYGDNDRLAARVAQMVMADGLVLLSDVDGLYTADPLVTPDAEHIAFVRAVDEAVLAMAGDTASSFGSGGMATKLQAARIATHAGCATVIARGHRERPLLSIGDGGKCSVFLAEGTPAAQRKQWLAGVLDVSGELRVDAGAAAALARGSSLLPVGLVEVVGHFRRGDAVTLVDADGEELGRGLVEYPSDEAAAIVGCQSDDIEQRLGYRGRSVIVHRDDLVLFKRKA